MRMNRHWTPGKDKPTDYLIACFADAPAAQAALNALRGADFTDEDLVSLDGTDGYEEIQRTVGGSPLRRLFFALEDAAGDETTGRAALIEELREGHSVVFVYAPDEERFSRARGDAPTPATLPAAAGDRPCPARTLPVLSALTC